MMEPRTAHTWAWFIVQYMLNNYLHCIYRVNILYIRNTEIHVVSADDMQNNFASIMSMKTALRLRFIEKTETFEKYCTCWYPSSGRDGRENLKFNPGHCKFFCISVLSLGMGYIWCIWLMPLTESCGKSSTPFIFSCYKPSWAKI